MKQHEHHATAQSGNPVTWDTIREGIVNTFLTPLRWLRDRWRALVERLFCR